MNKEALFNQIRRILRSGSLSHAYVLEGREPAVRSAGMYFVQGILCASPEKAPCGVCLSCRKTENGEHEDVILVEAVGTASLKDENIEAMQQRLAKKPYDGFRNVALICDAGTMTPRAQNRLLKTLEEPPGNAVLILLVDNAEKLLSTVRSRCIIYRLEDDGEADRPEWTQICAAAEQFGRMVQKKSPFYAMAEALTEVAADRETARLFLDALERWYRDLLLGPCFSEAQASKLLGREEERCFEAVRLLEDARKDLYRNNNAGYVLKGLALRLTE